MELSVQNVYGLLIRSKLLSLDDAKAMFARWQQEAKASATDVGRFAKWMVANQYLTEYQATLLARGHADGFFLNQYKILDRIGQGRMAGVYKAWHSIGQLVAIKVLPPSKARDPQMMGRFQREAHLSLRLKHPNVVRTFQTGEGNGLHYLVMEYLEGETLDEVLKRRGRLSPSEAVRLVYQSLLGLQHIHEQGLVHRDLKPANLMLTPAPLPGSGETTLRCTVKILDIGLGRVLFDEAVSGRPNDPTLTSEGALLGTPDYMAPEQARDARAADIRSDIYSLGCVLYHCLAGQPPFPDTNIISQMIRHATEAACPLKQFNAAVPDGLQQIVNFLMAKDPGQRYATPERAAQALQVFLAAGNEPIATPEADPRMRSFLTWLETDGKKKPGPPVAQATSARPAAAAPPTSAAAIRPAAPPLPSPASKIVASATRPTKTKKQSKRRSKKQKRKTSGLVQSSATSSSAPPMAQPLDIELVAAPTATASPSSPLQLTRREFVIFSAGAAVTGAAVLLGWLAATVLRRPPVDDSDPSGDSQ